MTKDKTGKSQAQAAGPEQPIAKNPKGPPQPHPGHPVPHGSGEGATGMQPGAGHPRGR